MECARRSSLHSYLLCGICLDRALHELAHRGEVSRFPRIHLLRASAVLVACAALTGCAEDAPAPTPAPAETVIETTVITPTTFDADIGAEGNYDWLRYELDRLAGDGSAASAAVESAVAPAVEAGWPVEITDDYTTLTDTKADYIQVALRDPSDMCLIGHIGTDDVIGVVVTPVLESTGTCLIGMPEVTE